MSSTNLFRDTIIGEALEAAVKEVQNKQGLSNETCDRILDKFDDVASKVICKEEPVNERGRPTPQTTITAYEHEFKFNDGIWKFILKNVNVAIEGSNKLNMKGLKVIACNQDNQKKEARRRANNTNSKSRKNN